MVHIDSTYLNEFRFILAEILLNMLETQKSLCQHENYITDHKNFINFYFQLKFYLVHKTS